MSKFKSSFFKYMSNQISSIQVLGSGCPSCKKLFELTKQAVQKLNIKTEVEYITDIQKIIEMGVMQTPVLAINGKPVMTGSALGLEKIMSLLSFGDGNNALEQKSGGCSCDGKC
jgi:small redox-active disulfide protein 2